MVGGSKAAIGSLYGGIRCCEPLCSHLTDEKGEWPPFVGELTCAASSTDPQACFRDPDGDGVLGVPFSMINLGTNYRATGCGLEGDQPVRFHSFRVDAALEACEPNCTRAVELHLGTRTRHAPRAAINACTDGGAELIGASSASAADMRAIGCETNVGEARL